MKKVCFVVQRYGVEVNGGAELQCRMMAERMLPFYDVDVLTTKAIDYMTWKDEYKNDKESINGVMVRRFSVEKQRSINEFNEINGKLLQGAVSTKEEEEEWIYKQGPAVPNLVNYIEENVNDYEAILFFTYLYYTTTMGIPKAGKKAICIPDAHDEPFLKMSIMKDVFLNAQAYFYNTIEEKKMINQKFHNEYIKNNIGGVGVDIPSDIDQQRFKDKYGLGDYIIYVGRIDRGKNCDIMFDYFREYKKRNKNNIKLVLIGKSVIKIPKDKDIIPLGFVEDIDKFEGIAGSRLLLLPSEFESLSIVVLEAMSLKKPVLVNGKCDVLKGHCTKSNGGLYYYDYFEFEGALNYLLGQTSIIQVMGENGLRYVNENYQWDVIVKKLANLIDYVSELNGKKAERK